MVQEWFTANAVIPEAPFDWDTWFLVETFALEALEGRENLELGVKVKDDDGATFTGESVLEVQRAVEKRGTKVNDISVRAMAKTTPIGPVEFTMVARGFWYSGVKAKAEYITFDDPVEFNSTSEPDAHGLAVSFDKRIERFIEKKEADRAAKEKESADLAALGKGLQAVSFPAAATPTGKVPWYNWHGWSRNVFAILGLAILGGVIGTALWVWIT